MKNRLSLFLSCILFLFSGCLLSEPDASRINENDPKSPFFSPNLSDLNTNVSPTEKKVGVNWKDESRFNEGFFIEKKFSKNDKYKTIDTVNVSIFTENLNEYTIGLQYRVTSFYLQNGVYQRGMKLETDSLNFGRLANFGYFSSNDTVFVQWYRRTAFDDLTTVEYKPTNDAEWNTGVTIPQDVLDSDFFRANFVLPRGRSYNLRINAFILNKNEDLEQFFTSPTLTISHN